MSTTCPLAFNRWKIALALALVCSLFLGYQRPAAADGAASTRNILLGAAAVAAAIALSNSGHTHVRFDAVVGNTDDGGVIYGDGRVRYPNGDVLYVSNGDGRPCGWAYGLPRCYRPVVYYPRYYHGHRHDRDDWHHDRYHDHDDHHHDHDHHDHDDH
jgi:hypothetical protein